MGYCTNANGALVPFANDKASCDAVGGTFTADVKPTFADSTDGFASALNPNTYLEASENIANYPYVGGALDILNPVEPVAEYIKSLSDPELRKATLEFVKQNPLKATLAGVAGFVTKKMKKVGSSARAAGLINAGSNVLADEDLGLIQNVQEYYIDPAKAELEKGIFNITGEATEEETTETKTEEEQRIADEKAADDLAKGRGSKEEEEARKSFSDRFKAGMKDPATINKLGMLMDYYGKNLQDRGENPLVAYEKAQATKAAAGKPDTAAFNAVDMSREDLENIFTPKKGWFKFRSEADREKAASNMIGRYRTIQNAAFTRHGVILTHAEIMKLLEDERDQAKAKAAATK